MSSDFIPPLHPQFRYFTERVGREQKPVLVVDNFIDRAELLIDIAERYCHFQNPTYFYPGPQALVPGFYPETINQRLGALICTTFGLPANAISRTDSLFAMVLKPPQHLAPSQSRPHVDCTSRSQLAAVHYLCGPEQGGTSLYRHRATGFEEIDGAKSDLLDQYLLEEEQDLSWQRKYINGSNQHYERIASYEAMFNRIVIYHGNILHSGNIASDFPFEPDPRRGRLTITSFIHI